MEKTTLQEIADQLKISRVTVSKVLNNKSGVSIKTRKKVINKLLENGYKMIDTQLIDFLDENKVIDYRCIAVVATAPEFSEFWLKIIKAITNALSESNYDCIYCFLSKNDENQSTLPKIIDSERINGVIVINVYDDNAIKTLSESGIPTVFLDINPKMYEKGIKGDVILLDGFRSVSEITNHIIANGRTELGFIGDITYSKTILERWEGFKNALKLNDLSINSNFCYTNSSFGHFYYKEEIEKILNEAHSLPKAFVCANDFIAFMLIDLLKKKNYRIPEDIAVSGFDDIKEKITEESNLTTVTINTDILGKRLVKQILMRIDDPNMPMEIIYIEPNVIYRDSTNI